MGAGPIRRPKPTGEMVVRPEDYDRSAHDYAASLIRARRRFQQIEGVTVREVRAVYLRVASEVRRDVARATAGTLRARHLGALEESLTRHARALNDGVLGALRSGISLAVETAVEPFRAIGTRLLGRAFPAPAVEALYAEVNDRTVATLLSRTRNDGLILSDRVWKASQLARREIGRILEDAVARQQDARTTAKLLEQYLKPGVAKPLKLETQKRLWVSSDVSMQALRLAVTETNNAFREGTVNGLRATPAAKGVYWRLSRVHAVADVCDDYARKGGTGFWPKDQVPVSPHPWCRCTLVPALEDEEQFYRRINRWLADPQSQPDLEDWYQQARPVLPRPDPAIAN